MASEKKFAFAAFALLLSIALASATSSNFVRLRTKKAALLIMLCMSVPLFAAPAVDCGTLSSSGPYTLNESVSISGSNCFTVTADNVTIDCAGFSITGDGTYYGIYSNATNTTIKNCGIISFFHAIFFQGATNGAISNTTASTTAVLGSGIYLSNASDYNTISGCAAVSDTGVAIYIKSDSNHNIIINSNGSSSSSQGIRLESGYNTVINSIGTSGIQPGIVITSTIGFIDGINNTISGSTGASGSNIGILITMGANNTITNSTGTSNTSIGIYFSQSTDSVLANSTARNLVSGASGYGIYVSTNSDRNQIINTTASSNLSSAIYIDGGTGNLIDCRGLTISGTNTSDTYGIYTSQSNTTIENCIVSNFSIGIFFDGATNSTVQNTTAVSTFPIGSGIYLASSTQNTLANISASSPAGFGISLNYGSDHNTLHAFNTTTVNASGMDLNASSYNVFSDFNATGIGDGHGGNGITMASSNNNTFHNFKSYSQFYSIRLDSSFNNTFHTFNGTSYGYYDILLSSSGNNSLYNFTASGAYMCILLGASSNNNFTDFSADAWSIWGNGIELDSSSDNNTFHNFNTTTTNANGFWLTSSTNNSFTDFSMTSLAGYGAYLSGFSGSRFSNGTIHAPANFSIYLAASSSNNSFSNITATTNLTSIRLLSSSANNTFVQNNLTGSAWVNDTGGGNNTFNASLIGNAYYFTNGTGSWEAYNITDSNGNNYADMGTDRPFNATMQVGLDGYWGGSGNDWHPFTINAYVPVVVSNNTEYSCLLKPCNTSFDCLHNDPPYCDGGCNLLSRTCYPRLTWNYEYCRPAGSACSADSQLQPDCGSWMCNTGICSVSAYFCPGRQQMPCCGDTYCNSTGYCTASKACGASCSNSTECASNCSICISGACQACITVGSATNCTSSTQCCAASGATAACDLFPSSANYSKCVSCLPEGSFVCTSDADCCSALACKEGTCRANNAPSQPQTPAISPSTASTSDTISCTQNCPSNPLPPDPDSDTPITMEYQWYANGFALTSYWHEWASLRCDELGTWCSSGDFIQLKSRACDPYDDCTESNFSNTATIAGGTPLTCVAAPQAACGAAAGECCFGMLCQYPSASSDAGTCCMHSNPTLTCSANDDCCSGKCQSDLITPGRQNCMDLWDCGQNCTNSSDCGEDCPQCASPSGGGQETCRLCIPSGSSTNCTANSQCCSNATGTAFCDLTPTSANHSKCISCLPENDSCSVDADCCSGRCQDRGIGPSSAGTARERICAPSLPSCSRQYASCLSDADCCNNTISPVQNLFCDTLNSYITTSYPLSKGIYNTTPISSYGMCANCHRPLFKCDGTHPCCNTTAGAYSCQLPVSGGSQEYCLPDPGISDTQFAGWARSADFEVTTSPADVHSGSAAIQATPGHNNTICSTELLSGARGDSKYSLEFWVNGTAPDILRYTLFDTANDAYLNSSGQWKYTQVSGGTISAAATNSISVGSPYARIIRNFKTLPNAKLLVCFTSNTPASNVDIDDALATQIYDFTISAWVKAGGTQSGNATIFYQATSMATSPVGPGIKWTMDSNNILNMSFTGLANGTGISTISTTLNLSDRQWHMVAFSADRTGYWASYLDGHMNSSGDFTLGRMSINSLEQFFIGSKNGTANFFNGSIDELRFYRRALTSDEIWQHYLGTYQQDCNFTIKAIYEGTPLSSQELSADYNAYLRIRTLPAQTLLSMPFDSNISSDETGAITDYSRFLLHGTKAGATWENSSIGGAYYFNGVNDKIQLPSPVLSGTDDFTISAWVNISGASPATSTVLGNYGSANTDGIQFAISSGYPTLLIAGSSATGNATITPGAWAHIAATRKNGAITFYINGAPAGTGTLSGSIGSSLNMSIGNAPDYTTDRFIGAIEEVRIFGIALDDAQALSLYNDQGLLSSGLVSASKD